MNFVAVFMLVFAILGALDRILGNRFGLGEQFERGFKLLGVMALSMIGMIVLAPLIAEWLTPVLAFFHDTLHIDPSILPASLFANDMGGAPLSVQVAADEAVGAYNALVVSSMMGCTVSFTIPYSLGVVKAEKHSDMFLGFLYGIVTIPIGCLVSGILLRIPFGTLLLNLLPLLLFAGVIAVGLALKPGLCIKIFSVFGRLMTILITVGLVLGMVQFLTDFEIVKGLDTLENGAMICVNAAVVLSGAFPFMFLVSKLLKKPLAALGRKWGINETSALGMVSTLATNATTFEMMNEMDSKGVVLNAAFAVSAAFMFGGHLAFTLAFDSGYILPVLVGKLVSGIAAAVLVTAVYFRKTSKV